MRIAKASYHGQAQWVIVEGDTAYKLEGDRFNGPRRGAPLAPLSQVKLLPPVEPHNKFVALLGNYGSRGVHDGPGIFVKPNSALIGDGDDIVCPRIAPTLNYEPEIAIVMGRRVRHATPSEGKAAILGYTISHDVTTTSMATKDRGPSIRYKAFDTFGVLGPWIVTDVDGDNLPLRSLLNGQPTKQDTNTSKMAWSIGEVVAWISSVMTLEPGDVISCGTPPGFGPMGVGDTIECVIDGIGRLKNRIVADPTTPQS